MDALFSIEEKIFLRYTTVSTAKKETAGSPYTAPNKTRTFF